ncbi:MAG: cytochrome c5 family protein, partial [Gammaproteobacteria bacterium]|nr:cytochrome c5 family protein [Gammaproteobacteria bacterium]
QTHYPIYEGSSQTAILRASCSRIACEASVSKQDTHFINMFSLVIGILVAFAVVLFVVARSIGSATQGKEVMSGPEYYKSVEARIAPVQQEAVAGQNNAALAIKPPEGATAQAGGSSGSAMPTSGKDLFDQTCSACHGAGVAGAPKAGDKAAWASHIAKGLPTLYDHALHGFTGSSGTMPAKGGRTDVPDPMVEQAVNYMVSLVDPAMVSGKKK